MITLQYSLNRDDYIQSTRAYYHMLWKRILPNVLLLLLVFSTMVFLPYFTTGNLNNFPWLGILVFCALLFGAWFYVSPQNTADKLEKDEMWTTPTTLNVSDEKFSITNKFFEGRMEWSYFHAVLESKAHFILFHSLSQNSLQIIPKRGFSSTGDEETFRSLVKEKVSIPNQTNKQTDASQTSSVTILLIILLMVIIGLSFTGWWLFGR